MGEDGATVVSVPAYSRTTLGPIASCVLVTVCVSKARVISLDLVVYVPSV